MANRFFAIAMTTAALALAPALTPDMAFAQGDAAEIAYWDTVKNSRSPAEVRSYLDKYPNGTFAALARIRLKNLEGGGGPAPTGSSGVPLPGPSGGSASAPPAGPSPTASALTSPTLIREVQDRLYNLNYAIKARNGRLTSDTRDAIRAWQERVKQPVTGDVTHAQLSLLRRAVVPTRWGALAYYAKGATATVWNRNSRDQAERDALSSCRKRAGAACNVVTIADKGCAALGFYNAVVSGRQYWGGYAFARPTLGAATASALEECRAKARSPNNCGVRTTVCADGSHSR